MSGNNGIEEGVHTGSRRFILDLKIQFVLFCIDCKPRGPTFGHTDQKTATVGGSIAVFGENNHKPVV
ncbi:hypothetical protein A4U88_1496 [Serratia marcescens]|nr:hypothetical protein A4U88_1496 [Serratia marcescens]